MTNDTFWLVVACKRIFWACYHRTTYDPIWFGVLLVVVLEMSLISPPLGLNVFVVKGIADGVPMGDIFLGVLLFWAAMPVCAVLLIIFPEIALFLPETMIR